MEHWKGKKIGGHCRRSVGDGVNGKEISHHRSVLVAGQAGGKACLR